MLAQMFPGMQWIPVIVLAIAIVFVCAVVLGSILISRLLPIKSARPEVVRNVRLSVAALIASPILLLAARSCAPLGGPDPRQLIAIGMTTDQVRGILGKPHQQRADAEGGETWYYYRDWITLLGLTMTGRFTNSGWSSAPHSAPFPKTPAIGASRGSKTPGGDGLPQLRFRRAV